MRCAVFYFQTNIFHAILQCILSDIFKFPLLAWFIIFHIYELKQFTSNFYCFVENPPGLEIPSVPQVSCASTFLPSASVSAEFLLFESTFLSSCVIDRITGETLWLPISKWSDKTHAEGWGAYIRLQSNMRQESSRSLLRWETTAPEGQVRCYIPEDDGLH